MTTTIISADNGISGGIVATSAHNGAIISKHLMPVMKHVRKGNPYGKSKSAKTDRITTEVDFHALRNLLLDIDRADKCVAVMEDCPDHAPSAASLRSMAFSAGVLHSALLSFGCRIIRIRPEEWQDQMLGKVPKGKTKEYALNLARNLWPQESWLATARSSKPSDALVDAALIAEYARLHKTL